MSPAVSSPVWLLQCSALLVIALGGLACLDFSQTRLAERAGAGIRAVVTFGVSTLGFWVAGCGLALGDSWHSVVGMSGFLAGLAGKLPVTPAEYLLASLMVSLGCAVALTTPAIRMRIRAQILWVALLSAVVFPWVMHIIWAQTPSGTGIGFLRLAHYLDQGGAAVLLVTAAGAAYAFVRVTRHSGRGGGGESMHPTGFPLESHYTAWRVTGAVMLTLGLAGAALGRAGGPDDDPAGIALNLLLGSASGIAIATAGSLLILRRLTVPALAGGLLGGAIGLLSIPTGLPTPLTVAIGGMGAIIALMGGRYWRRRHPGDGSALIGVLAAAGIWGVLAAGAFGHPFFAEVGPRLGLQIIGAFVCALAGFGLSLLGLAGIRHFTPLRPSQEEQEEDLDAGEYGVNNPLGQFLGVMDEHALRKNLEERVPVDPQSAAGTLATRYNRVASVLQDAVGFHRALQNAIPDGMVVFDRESLKIDRLNFLAETLFGSPMESLVGKLVTDYIRIRPSSLADGVFSAPRSYLDHWCDTGGPVQVQLRPRNGNPLEISLEVTRAGLSDGVHYIAIFRPVVEEKRRVEEEEKENAAQEEREKQGPQRRDIPAERLVELIVMAATPGFAKRGQPLQQFVEDEAGTYEGYPEEVRSLTNSLLTQCISTDASVPVMVACRRFDHPETGAPWLCLRVLACQSDFLRPPSTAQFQAAERLGGTIVAGDPAQEQSARIDLYLPAVAPELTGQMIPEATRVLLIEDDPRYRAVLQKLLAGHKCEVLEAPDGSIGLQFLWQQRVDLVVLDLSMPNLNGFQVLEKLRELPFSRRPPVLVLSGQELTAEERTRLSENARRVLPKHEDPIPAISEEIEAIKAERSATASRGFGGVALVN